MNATCDLPGVPRNESAASYLTFNMVTIRKVCCAQMKIMVQ